MYNTNCASPLNVTTPTNGPTPLSCDNLRKEVTGLAARQLNALRLAGGKDSGKTK